MALARLLAGGLHGHSFHEHLDEDTAAVFDVECKVGLEDSVPKTAWLAISIGSFRKIG